MDVEGPARLEKARVAKGEAKAVAKTCHIKCTDRGGPGRKDIQPCSHPASQPSSQPARMSKGAECFYCCRNSAWHLPLKFQLKTWLPLRFFLSIWPGLFMQLYLDSMVMFQQLA